jgi:cation:H+ antiporter
MLISIFYILGSLILFYFGSSWLSKGSSELAVKAGISPLVIGLTIVAFGSSAPALFVSGNAALAGYGNIVIGNIIGSNMFNICVVLGISAIIAPLNIKLQLLKLMIPVLIISTIGFMILFSDRQISRVEGGVLLGGIILYTIFIIIFARRKKDNEYMNELSNPVADAKITWYWSAGMIVTGIALLVAGSELLLKGSNLIASSLGVGETIIGITLIASVTSVPILISSVVAVKRKEYDAAIGNVIGANIFNILGIIGISGLISPLSAIAISNIDLYIMLGFTMFLIPFLKKSYILKRDEGIFMIVLYFMYMFYLWPR